MRLLISMVPIKGLEPLTYALRMRCSTNCAKSAFALLTIIVYHGK